MFISKIKFIDLFDDETISFSEFMKEAKVKTSSGLVKLKDYMKKNEIDQSDVKLLHSHIKEKRAYLLRFYDTSLKLPEELDIREAPMKTSFNNNEKIKYKNVIRNLHYLDILQNTKSGLYNTPSYLQVLIDLYNSYIIDYKLLTPSAIYYLKNNRFGGVFSSFYFRASIMNPYLVYSLNESLLHGTKIFTPTLGWSSYAYGFLESSMVEEYVGTDVIPKVCLKTRELAKIYKNTKTKIYCKPSEVLLSNASFKKKYSNYFDVVFFSPPYYELELYDSENQSTSLYKTYEEWLFKYWDKTICLCYNSLVKGGRLCYILSGYGKDLQYDLVSDMNNITKKYFKQNKIIDMQNKNANMTKHRVSDEKIMLFIKP